MRCWVVIPTFDGRERVLEAVASLQAQTRPPQGIVVVDNASRDRTSEALASEFPWVRVVRAERNLGFGRAVNRGVAEIPADTDAIVLVNNDCVCEPGFLEALVEPLADPSVGMVAGVLLQDDAPELVDSAGIELDATLGSWDRWWNRPVADIPERPAPVGPCGGAAAYRAEAFRAAGGFDETLFAYWEDVDLALRLQRAGWRSAAATGARARHRHGATLGAASPAQRRLHAFGRGYVLARYRVPQRGLVTRAAIAALDWPALLVHLLVRRELGPIRLRAQGMRAGYAREGLEAPVHLATVSLARALGRHASLLGLRFTGRLPRHFASHAPDGTRG